MKEGVKHTNESKQKTSNTMKKNWASLTPEQKEAQRRAISEGMKRKWAAKKAKTSKV